MAYLTLDNGHLLDFHARVHDFSIFDDRAAVQADGAVAHRNVVVSPRVASAAALCVRACREKKVPGKCARGAAMTLRIIAVEGDAIPQRLRIHPPSEMRDGERIAIVLVRLVVREPVAHELGVEAALDPGDEAIADLHPHGVDDVAAVREDDNVARLEDDRPGRAALIGKSMNEAAAT